MNQTLEVILSKLLGWKEESGNQDVVELLKEKKGELGLSDESMALVLESFDYIDKFSEKSASLAAAQEDGISRKRWLISDIEKSLENFDEEDKTQVMQEISERMEATINSQTEEE